jgi:hypothetical protein
MMMVPWLRQQWNDIKGHVKFAVLLFVGGSVVTLVVALTHGLVLWQQVVLAGCFVVLFGWALFETGAASRHHLLGPPPAELPKLQRLLLRQMEQKCESILSVYRRLEYDDRERVRFPFSNSSWPAFGEKWEYVHVTLYRLRIDMALFKVEVIQLCGVLGESEVPFPDIGESVLMVDLLAAMQSLADFLKGESHFPVKPNHNL